MESKKTPADFLEYVSSFTDDYPFTKGFITHLLHEWSYNIPKTQAALLSLCKSKKTDEVNENALRHALNSLLNAVRKKKKNLHREWPEIVKMLMEPFPLPLKTRSEPAVISATSIPALSLCGATASLTSLPLLSTSVASSSATTVSITSTPLTSAPFISGPLTSTPIAPSSATTVSIASFPLTSTPITHGPLTSTPIATKPISCIGASPNVSPVSGKSPPYKRLKNDCQGCPIKRTVNQNLRLENIRLRQKQREQAREYRTALTKYSPGRVGQALKRKDKSVQKWKTKFQTIKLQKEKVDKNLQKLSANEATLEDVRKSNKEMAIRIAELEKTNVETSAQLTKLQKKYDELTGKYAQLQRKSKADNYESLKQLKTVEKQCNKERQALTAVYENQLLHMQEEHDDANTHTVDTKHDKKTYTSQLRKCMFKCLLSQVSVQYCSELIIYIGKELFNKQLTETPDKTVVAQMAYELGVLADIQTGFVLDTADTITLAWDATSLKGCHINEVHINTKDQGLTLNIAQLPGGKAEDYHSHIVDSLGDVIGTYCMAFGKCQIDVKRSMIDAIKSTISDRASVNHCVVELLKESFDTDLLELNCNVHPLDGLAHAARDALHTLDLKWHVKSQSFRTNGCILASLIHCISKMRYKQGSGDPGGFLTYLRENKLKPGIILRYVGNRLHVMFHMAAVLFHHHATLLRYFQMKCSSTNSLRTAILHDFQQGGIIAQLQAVGLFAKLVTGPWMTVLYQNDKKRSNLQVVSDGIFTSCLEFLNLLTSDPGLALSANSDAFGNDLEMSDITRTLQQIPSDPEQKAHMLEAIAVIATGFINKLKGQLHRYISGPLSDPTPQMLSDASSAPVHNMFAERTLGMMDALWRRAPNATLGFVDGKVKGRQNRTLEWLETFSTEEQERLIKFAIGRGAKIRALRLQRSKHVQAVQLQRQNLMSQKRDMRHRKRLEGDIKTSISNKSLSASMDIFQSCDESQGKKLGEFLANPAAHVGSILTHVWFEDGKDVVYFERVRAVKQKKETEITLTYWQAGQTPESRADYTITLVKFLADFALGDLKFV